MNRSKAYWVLALSALLAAGCRSAQTGTPAGQGQPALEQAVRSNLQSAPGLDSSNIQVDVIDGVAVLSGTVPTDQERMQAAEAARQTSGVQDVRDRLMVSGSQSGTQAPAPQPMQQPSASQPSGQGTTQQPSGTQPPSASQPSGQGTTQQPAGQGTMQQPSGSQPSAQTGAQQPAGRSQANLSQRVNEAIQAHTSLASQNIEVRTHGSTATLTGTVSSQEEKQQAAAIAGSVNGVSRVENNLKVKPQR